jgi:hypothetical protein
MNQSLDIGDASEINPPSKRVRFHPVIPVSNQNSSKMIDELNTYLAEPPAIPLEEKEKPVMFHPLEY